MSVNQAPLSVRNNNPGNLRFVGQEGASQGEGGFAKFETPEAGLAAMRNQIELDTQTRGLNLTEFLNKYAPPSENKTSNYIDFVVKRTGLDPAARVPVERIADLQKAMIEMEGGPRALSAFNIAVPPRTTAQKVAAPATRTTVQAAKPAVQVAAAINPSELPSNYTSALALSYLSDTDPEGKIMGRVNEMLEEMQGGAAKPPGGATLQKFAQSERVDPFKLMAQAQQEEEPKQRKAVPRMPVRMATGGPVGEMAATQATEVDGFANGGLATRALAANRPKLTETDYTKLKGIQSEFEDYNKRVEDYQKAIDAYNAKVEAYNAAGGEGVENPGEFTTAEPTAPGTTVEQAEAFKKEAEERAKRFYAARSTALQSIVNPEKYNLSGMSFGFEKGGEVNMDQQQAEFNATQDMDEYRKKSQEMLYNLRTNLGPVTGQFVPGRQGVDVRASTQVAGVRPFVDVSPNEMAVTRFGASYGRMGPQGGYDITVEQPAAVPTPAGPVNLPPSLRGVYAQPLGKDGTFAVEGMYSPGPNPQYRVGARLIKRFENGGMANANPADIAEQMTVGTLPEDQRPAGEVFRGIGRDIVRGAQYLPYDLLGAPVDIATMAMRPFGYNVEKPVGGGEYLIEKARQAGIAQAPTGSAAETATRIGMGFVNPMAGARQIGRGIEAVRRGAETMELPGVTQTAPVGSLFPKQPVDTSILLPKENKPFIGEVERIVADLSGPVTKQQFIGMMRKQGRNYEIGRVENALEGLSDQEKISPQVLLEKLQASSPGRFTTEIIPPGTKYMYDGMDNPFPSNKPGAVNLLLDLPKDQQEVMNLQDKARNILNDLSPYSFLKNPYNARSGTFENLQELTGTTSQRIDSMLPVIKELGDMTGKNVKDIIDPLQRVAEVGDAVIELGKVRSIFAYPALTKTWDTFSKMKDENLPVELKGRFGTLNVNSLLAKIFEDGIAQYEKVINEVPMAGRSAIAEKEIKTLKDSLQKMRRNEVELEVVRPQVSAAEDKLSEYIDDTLKSLRNQLDRVSNRVQKLADEVPTAYYEGTHRAITSKNPISFSRFVEFSPEQAANLNLPLPEDGRGAIMFLELQSDRQKALRLSKEVEEAFPNMAKLPQVTQQLMIKNAIYGAMKMDKGLILFPGSDSAQAQLYEKLGPNLKQVVKDLGPGFDIKQVTFTNEKGQEATRLGVSIDKKAAERVLTQGIRFAKGGMVDKPLYDRAA